MSDTNHRHWTWAWAALAITLPTLTPARAQQRESTRSPVPVDAPTRTDENDTAALRGALERAIAGKVSGDARGFDTLAPAPQAGFWSARTGRFLAPDTQQSSVLFTDLDDPTMPRVEWPVGFDRLPRQVAAREFGGGDVVAAASVTIELRPRTAVAWLRWELGADGAPMLRCVAQTVVGGLLPDAGERIDAASFGELEIAGWNAATMEATLLVGSRDGAAYTVQVPFQGRPGTTIEDLGPFGRWQQRPEEDLVAQFVGLGRDVRAVEVGGRMLISLRSDALPSGGRSVAGELPLDVYEREASGAWRALQTSGETPRVGVGYTPWVGDDGAARWSSLVGAGSRELHTFELALEGTSVRWAAPRVVDTGEVESVTRLALERTRDGQALVTRTADGGAVRLPTGE